MSGHILIVRSHNESRGGSKKGKRGTTEIYAHNKKRIEDAPERHISYIDKEER